jgi:hypothetical protein
VSINAKDESSPALPPCPTCVATMDLKRRKSFASIRIGDDGRLYYCSNPIFPSDELERKQRLLLFGFS